MKNCETYRLTNKVMMIDPCQCDDMLLPHQLMILTFNVRIENLPLTMFKHQGHLVQIFHYRLD